MHSRSERKRGVGETSRCIVGILLAAGTAGAARAQTTATWMGASSGSWFDPSRWSGNAIPHFGNPPGSEYRAVIDAAGSAYTISLAQNLRLASLRLDSSSATVEHSGGVFTLDDVADLVRGQWRLNGGTIRGGTLAFSVTPNVLRFSSSALNTLDGVTISGTATFSDNLGVVTVRNGLAFAPGASVTLSGIAFNASFQGSQTITGGAIHLGSLVHNTTLTVGASTALTLSPTTTVDSAGAIMGATGSQLVNQGLLLGSVGTRTLTVLAPVANSGTLGATLGGTLALSAPVTSTGLVQADGGTVRFSGGYTGAGQVRAMNSGVFEFTGGVVSGVLTGAQTTTGGYIKVGGVIENSSSTLSINAGGPRFSLITRRFRVARWYSPTDASCWAATS